MRKIDSIFLAPRYDAEFNNSEGIIIKRDGEAIFYIKLSENLIKQIKQELRKNLESE